MTDQTLDLIRKMVARGMDNDAIRAVLDVVGDETPDNDIAPHTGNRGRPRTAIQTAPQTQTGRPGIRAFVKPDTTRTIYSMNPRVFRGDRRSWRALLDRHAVNGNQRLVAEYIIRNGGSADSREIRASVLREKLHADGITNKAVESAIHGLKTRVPPIIVRESKPANGYESDTAVDA